MSGYQAIYQKLLDYSGGNWLGVLDWGNSISLGDFGTYYAGSFTKLGNIGTAHSSGPYQIAFTSTAGEELTPTRDFGVCSSGYVQADGSLSMVAPNPPPTSGTLSFEWAFTTAGSMSLLANNCVENSIDELATVLQALSAKVAKVGGWDENTYQVVTSVLMLKSGALIGTATDKSSLSISGKANAIIDFVNGTGSAGYTESTTSWSGMKNLYPSSDGSDGGSACVIAIQAWYWDSGWKQITPN